MRPLMMHVTNNAVQSIPVRGESGALGCSRFLEEVTDPFGKHARVPLPTIGGVTPVSAHRPMLLTARLLLSQARPHLELLPGTYWVLLALAFLYLAHMYKVRACVGVCMCTLV
jgi:hypothetical protein